MKLQISQKVAIALATVIALLLMITIHNVRNARADLPDQGKSVIEKTFYDYEDTPVTTGAWVEIVHSLPQAATEVEIFDSSGQTLQISFGAVGAEEANTKNYIFPGGNGRVPLKISQGTRISIKAITDDASAGYSVINFYQ